VINILYTTYNRLEYTKKTLPVLIQNTKHKDKRFIVVDNHSTDGTQKWLKEFTKNKKDIWLIENKKNVGVVGAMNQCLGFCDGLMAKVDNDTLVPEKWLTTLLRALHEHSLFAIGAKHKIMHSGYGDWADWMKDLEKIETFDGNLYLTKYVGGSGVVFRTEGIKEIPARGRFFGWGELQEQLSQQGRLIAFHEGVYIDLLDMECDNKYNMDFIDYRLKVGRVKNAKQLL